MLYNRLWDEDPDAQKERTTRKADGIAQAVILQIKERIVV